jgi:hypothetical protein
MYPLNNLKEMEPRTKIKMMWKEFEYIKLQGVLGMVFSILGTNTTIKKLKISS